MNNEKLKEVLEQAVLTVLSRSGDVDTQDGCFATVGTDEIIRLDYAIAELFELDSDDCNHEDIPKITAMISDFFNKN